MKDSPSIILLVEDDEAHAEIVRRHFESFSIPSRLMHFADGQVALDYLYQRKQFSPPADAPRPNLILLDLNLPVISGLELLKIIKEDANLKRIPVTILSTSNSASDVDQAYDWYSNSYLVKPMNLEKFTKMLDSCGNYWLKKNLAST